MDDAVLVRRFQRFRNLSGNPQRILNWNRSLSDVVGERGPFNQLQHQCANTISVFKTVDSADVGMVQRRKHLRFALKASKPFRIIREEGGQNLERDIAIELGIPRPIHLTHSATAERREDLIGAESRAAP